MKNYQEKLSEIDSAIEELKLKRRELINSDTSTIGSRIRYAMMMKGISQKELASIIGTYAPNISRYMCGKNIPNAEVIGIISKALGVSCDFLILGDNAPESHED